jgi:DNA-3-methyladenine glycosylase II
MNMRQTLKLKCVPPYDFDLSMRLFSDGDKQVRRYEEGKFWQAVSVEGKIVLVTLKATGTVDVPEVSAELESDQEISVEDRRKCRQLLSIMLGADFDLRSFYRQAKKDKIMMGIVQKLRGLKVPSTVTAFEALVDSIVEQQISLNVAHVLQVNLIKKYGDPLDLETGVYYAYPTPQKLALAEIKDLRKCGLSTRKAEYIRNVSETIVEGKLDVENFKRYTDVSKIVEELDKINGVGVWTAELTVVRGMQKYDVIPADDLGLRRVISHFYFDGEKIAPDDAREMAQKWGEWKGLASFYLVVAETLED